MKVSFDMWVFIGVRENSSRGNIDHRVLVIRRMGVGNVVARVNW